MVCADTEEDARAAADKVKVDLEALPAYLNATEALRPGAIEIHPGTPNVFFRAGVKKGAETEPIMVTAAHVVEDFYTQRQPHLAWNPMSASPSRRRGA